MPLYRTMWRVQKGLLPMPELLTSMSRLPPVAALTAFKASFTDSMLATSSGRMVIPIPLRCSILERSLAVANTRWPLPWNDCARASPIPPELQPVIKTVFLGEKDAMVDSTANENLFLDFLSEYSRCHRRVEWLKLSRKKVTRIPVFELKTS